MKTKLDQIWIPPTPVQRYVRDGRYPSGKAVPCNWKSLGSNPSGVNLQDYRQDQGHHGDFFFGFFLGVFFLTLSSLLGIPENARFLPTCGPPGRQGLGIQF